MDDKSQSQHGEQSGRSRVSFHSFNNTKDRLIMHPVLRGRYKGFNKFCLVKSPIVSFRSFGYESELWALLQVCPMIDPRMSRGIRSYLCYQIKACSLAPWRGRLAMKIGNGSSRK